MPVSSACASASASAGASAGMADPKNQNYIAIPFICHLWERSVTTQSWVIEKKKLPVAGAGNADPKNQIYSNTFHLPPLGVLCDHPELSYFPLEKTLWTNDNDDEGAFNIDDVTCHSLIYKIMSHATA